MPRSPRLFRDFGRDPDAARTLAGKWRFECYLHRPVRSRPRISDTRLPSWIALGLMAALGCGDGGSPRPQLGDGVFGARCTKTEDCASGLCVRLDATGGICTTACEADQQCPPSDNWACLYSSADRFDVCACRKLADAEICGDGMDNDCNGKVDDCRVCNDRQVPATDPNNCGGCGNVCGGGKSCDGTACVCPMTAP